MRRHWRGGERICFLRVSNPRRRLKAGLLEDSLRTRIDVPGARLLGSEGVDFLVGGPDRREDSLTLRQFFKPLLVIAIPEIELQIFRRRAQCIGDSS